MSNAELINLILQFRNGVSDLYVKNDMGVYFENSVDIFYKTKEEAYKEFAERLKKHTRKMQSSDFSGEFWDKAVLVADIDNILKELVGEDK